MTVDYLAGVTGCDIQGVGSDKHTEHYEEPIPPTGKLPDNSLTE